MANHDESARPDVLVRGGISNPAHLLEQAQECLALKGFAAVSAWGLPGDSVVNAAERMPGRNPKIRVIHRSKLKEAGYELQNRQDGHTSIMLPSLTIEACEALAEIFDPPIARPRRDPGQ